jgi:thiol-disulfide isomerase/thioredoxin
MSFARSAHPYRDIDVIDARAPRFNQATVGVVSLVAVLTGLWPLLAILAAQLGIGLRFGRRYCLPCVAYFELVQPRFGEGPIEDSRPPKFANQIGFVVLSAATISFALGLAAVGSVLGMIVAALALLAAATGLCVGCELYRIGARLRGIRRRQIDHVELAELGVAAGVGDVLVAFGHPLCTDCRSVLRDLERGSERYVSVDVRDRPDLARRYGVALVPTVVRVGADGRVVQQMAG